MFRVARSPGSRSGMLGSRTNAKSAAVTRAMPALKSMARRDGFACRSGRSGSGAWVLGRSLTAVSFFLFIRCLVVFVSLDDLLDQFVANHIAVCEIDEL